MTTNANNMNGWNKPIFSNLSKEEKAEIVKEFKNRNYNVYITNFNDVFSALNSLLAEKDKTATEALERITSSYEPGVLIQIKQELLNDPDHLSKFGAVIDFFDKKIKSVLS